MSDSAPKLLFILNEPTYFISHRLPIAIAAQKVGYKIHVAAGEQRVLAKIKEARFTYHPLPLSRSGRNLFAELRSLFALYRLMKRIKPDLVHLVTIKPVVYGAIAARLANVPGVVAAVSGLGYAFIDQHLEAKFLRKIIIQLYRFAFKHPNVKIIFQNQDDQQILLQAKALHKAQSVIIRGSGVDLDQYRFTQEPANTPLVVIMAARLLKDKGVIEYIEAAKIVKERGLQVRFMLAGSLDPGNPSSIKQRQLNEWIQQGDIEFIGYQDNIADLFPRVNLVILPSYREGLPRVLAEAAACGRAVVTTDVAGCRGAIIPNKTGFLVKPRDAISLANAIHTLLIDTKLRHAMGLNGRKFAEQTFNITQIVAQHLNVYADIRNHGPGE